jgi:excalibur calcium-binding domain-containing protein
MLIAPAVVVWVAALAFQFATDRSSEPAPRTSWVQPTERPSVAPTIADLVRTPVPVVTTPAAPEPYYRSCMEARAAGAAPIRRGEPGYRVGLGRRGRSDSEGDSAPARRAGTREGLAMSETKYTPTTDAVKIDVHAYKTAEQNHTVVEHGDKGMTCIYCSEAWPCAVRKALDSTSTYAIEKQRKEQRERSLGF